MSLSNHYQVRNKSLCLTFFYACFVISTCKRLISFRPIIIYLTDLFTPCLNTRKQNVTLFCSKGLSTLLQRNLKTEVSPWKPINFFLSTPHRRNLKTQQSHLDADDFAKLPVQNGFPPHENEKLVFLNSFSLKSVFKIKAPFLWRISVAVGLTAEKKLRFQILRSGVYAVQIDNDIKMTSLVLATSIVKLCRYRTKINPKYISLESCT